MSNDPPDDGTHSIGHQDSSNNNLSYLLDENQGLKTSFSHLSDVEKEILLRNAGFLYGFLVNSKDGPRRSTQSGVKLRNREQNISRYVQECNNIITEVIPTHSDRESIFAHQGWSASSISTITPWISSRIKNSNQTLWENHWVTKRIVVQRLEIAVSLRDLEPAPEFEEDMLAALEKPSRPEKFQALDQVFQHWGDVIPLTLDIGTSMAITDSRGNFDQTSNSNHTNDLHNLAAFTTGTISTQGGEANFLPAGDAKAWIARVVQPHLWSRVRVVQVAPITSILKPDINEKLVDLYSTLLSYRLPLDKPTRDSKIFDGSPHVLKTISSLAIHSNNEKILGISLAYRDGTTSGEHGDCGAKLPVFILNKGEHINEVMVWADSGWVYALQFTTSDGRISPHYGGTSGTPTIVSSTDGILVALSGLLKLNVLHRLQTIWRHDVVKSNTIQKESVFQYVGGSGGDPFNDRSYLQFSNSTYISSISVKGSDAIDNIQVTYADKDAGGVVHTEGDSHGGAAGTGSVFKLNAGEHITGAQGRQNGRIYQLAFTTNLGRISDIYGGTAGDFFRCHPPKKENNPAMRLGYIAGKSGRQLDGVLFVWVPM